jgi:hypothetical protein
VLQSETFSLSGGVHHWERKPVIRDDDDDDDDDDVWW